MTDDPLIKTMLAEGETHMKGPDVNDVYRRARRRQVRRRVAATTGFSAFALSAVVTVAAAQGHTQTELRHSVAAPVPATSITKPMTTEPSTPDSATPSWTAPPQASDSFEAAKEAIAALEASHPDQFAGIVVDIPKNTIFLYRKPSSELDAAARAIAARHDVRLNIDDAKYSHRQLLAVVDEVAARTPSLKKAGATLGLVFVDPTGAGVTVDVSGDVAAARKGLADLGSVVKFTENKYGVVLAR